MTPDELQQSLSDIANRMRIASIRSTAKAGSGHPTTCCSAADLVAALFFTEMRLDLEDPKDPAADRFLLSKGHGAPLLFAVWAELGVADPSWVDTLREYQSDYEGHPTPRLPFVDVASGSLGQGMSIALGMALAQRSDPYGARTFVLCGDGELAEGSVWEAAELAGHLGVGNLTAVVDMNGLGQSCHTMYGHDAARLSSVFAAYGWQTVTIDGHDMGEILDAFQTVRDVEDQPCVIIARTVKGKGIPGVEGKNGWHGKPVTGDLEDGAVEHLQGLVQGGVVPEPRQATRVERPVRQTVKLTSVDYEPDAKVATRSAFGDALLQLGDTDPAIVGIDGDTQNSTYLERFGDAHPDRFIEAYIAEQNMVGIAIGQAALGRIPFVATFAAFFTRAFDQIRMGAISRADVKLCGSHAGVSIGADGPSQMGLEDLAMMQSVPGAVVLYPSDGYAACRATELAANYEGIVYLRTSRPATPLVYTADDEFEIGRARVLRRSDDDALTIVAGGVTLFEALEAADMLEQAGVRARVVDLFSVKPIDVETLLECARSTHGRVLTVEDHYPEGGIGDAVARALSPHGVCVQRLAVDGLPRSGKPDELLHAFKIDASGILEAARGLLG